MRQTDTETRTTLFGRLCEPDNRVAWREFEERYGGMLLRFCRSLGLQQADAEDAVQAVLAKLAAGLARFQYDRQRGRFRDYLFRCARSAIADLKRGQKRAVTRVVPAAVEQNGVVEGDDALHRHFEREWVHHHYRLAIDRVRTTTDPRSIAIFEEALRDRPVREIAKEMRMSEDAVYKSLQRMRERLRDQIARQMREEDGSA